MNNARYQEESVSIMSGLIGPILEFAKGNLKTEELYEVLYQAGNEVYGKGWWDGHELAGGPEMLDAAMREAWHAARKFKASENSPGSIIFEYQTFEEWKGEKETKEA